MDAPLLLSVNLDLNLSCRGGGLAIFAGLSEIGDFRQAKAKNSDENLILQTFGNLFFLFAQWFFCSKISA